MRILITGADGFIGKNLGLRLAERNDVEAVRFTRDHPESFLKAALAEVDLVFHLAGVNRPRDPSEFLTGNVDLTADLVRAVKEEMIAHGRKVPVIYTSSIQALRDNPYGLSKRAAEVALRRFGDDMGAPVTIFRLPNVFGKWARPNYNSVVATFCNNIARGLPIRIDDPDAELTLVYIDDVVDHFIHVAQNVSAGNQPAEFQEVSPVYKTTVGEIAELIKSFRRSREALLTERVGTGFERALYSTYLSYLPPEAFSYSVPQYGDSRGVFVEMLKTPDCGQFSFFTAHPGVTRGGHYHHTKTEKFLVIKGEARFRFRHMKTGETYEIITRGSQAEIVETVPGWAHDITNIGEEELVVMLWANEIFDVERPDTYAYPL
jgi:UDP-2-acetamido-2,6-beta-L-arabino-hexul-4-ose reductase